LIFKRKSEAVVVALPADVHVNSTIGVLPRYCAREEGGFHRNDATQNWLRRCWDKDWDRIWNIKKDVGGPLVTIAPGDLVDDPKHATVQVVSAHEVTILHMGMEVFGRPREMSDHFVVVQGTEAHTGLGNKLEALLGEMLEAEPTEDGRFSWPYWRGELGGLKIDVAHHAQTSGRLPHTMSAAPSRQSFMVELESVRADEEVPDVEVRAHNHYGGDSGIFTKPRTFYCPPWQLTPAFGQRLGAKGKTVRPVGTLVLIIKDGRLTPDVVPYRAPEGARWTLPG